MRVEPLAVMPPKVERPAATGAAVSASVEDKLLSNNPELPVQPVSAIEKVSATTNRSETVWLESEQRTVYRVLDEKTGDVVTQIPSDEVLRVSRKIDDLLQEDAPKKLDIES